MVLKFLIQKKVILILLLFSFFLVLAFSVRADWLKKPVFLDVLNENLSQKLNKVSQVLAQEMPHFFPRFPQRLIHVLSESDNLIDEMIELNEELNNRLKESNCNLALSECLPRITFGGISCQTGRVLGLPYENIKEIEEKKEEISDRIDNLSFLRKLLKREMEGGLPRELETLRPEVAEELKNELEKVLKESEEIILTAKENQNLYNKDYTKNCVAQCQPGPVCGIKACARLGTGPQRNININAKLGVSLDDLDLGEIGIDKFGLALPDKLQFPQLGDITLTVPPQSISVCFPFKPISISVNPPSFATLPNLSFSCPKLPWPDLKLPELTIPKLPKEIKIPFPSIPEIKFCPAIPEAPDFKELEKIRQELIAAGEQEIGQFKKKIDEAINQINEVSEKATGEKKEKLDKLKKDLQEEYKKVKEEIPTEAKTPPIEFGAEQASKEYQYQSPESKDLEMEDISLLYQCGQTAGDGRVETKAGINWYFKRLSWLMENCANLPTMSSALGLKEKAADCYDPGKVIKTIINECDSLWKNYCEPESMAPEPPQICKEIRHSCGLINSDITAAIQCQNLFNQKGLKIPSECNYIPANYDYETEYYCQNLNYPKLRNKVCLSKNFNPVPVLKNKCLELKNQGQEEIPLSCKILPLFTGQIEDPDQETYYSSKDISCPAQSLLNLPFGFGGGIGLNCPIGLPSLPKIVLPDIVIPDVKLPEFGIPPFLKVKLPNIIIEDLILPDIELCDLNDCANIFPSLNFKLPQLNLPSLDLSAPLPQLPGLELRGKIDFPSISFSMPQINLFNLLLPELKLPDISIPSPKINFAITGIDISAIFDLIFTFILNALGIPDFGFCLAFKIPTVFLSFVFPDYYFSFLKFPEIPEIPFCENIRAFCSKVKTALGEGGWVKKAKEIETEFNKTIDKIQKEIDKVNKVVEVVQETIDKVFKEIYGKIIYDAIVKQLTDKGLSLEDYINPETKEIDLNKLPFPGVFPVKTVETTPEGIKLERECLSIPLPQLDVVLRIGNYPKTKIEKKLWPPPFQIVIYAPVNIPLEISIPWPERLKNINLINPLTYSLPKIPLSGLSYEREFSIKGPGFQPRTFAFDFGKINDGDCLAEPPKGGNPFPIAQITGNISEIKNIQADIKSASQTIIEILE